jgi:hypothetical protein
MPAPQYPWNKWFSKHQLRLKRGIHYRIMPHVMAQQIRNEAVARKRHVSIQIIEDVLLVKL